jgi:UMP-CMP kinase
MTQNDEKATKDYVAYFILGGPGAGKGTLCSLLSSKVSGVQHFSAGDLLRAERDKGTENAQLINDYIREGLIVPREITIALLKDAMDASPATIYLIDGFPRAVDQAEAFEQIVTPGRACIYLVCTEEVMEQRILGRGRESGRIDDNPESLRKRFHVFEEATMPVIKSFEATDRLIRVDATRTPDEVYQECREILLKK